MTYQGDYPHYMTLQTQLQHAGHSNTNICTGHCFCRHAYLSNQWEFFLSGWLNQPIVSQSSSISCSVDILWMTFPMFISLEKLHCVSFYTYHGAGSMMVTRSQAAIPINTVFVADFILCLPLIKQFRFDLFAILWTQG